MKIGRTGQIEFSDLIARFAEGQHTREIANSLGVKTNVIDKRVHRHLRMAGYKTLRQAVAHYAARKIQAAMPLALRGQVEIVAARWHPRPEWVKRRTDYVPVAKRAGFTRNGRRLVEKMREENPGSRED